MKKTGIFALICALLLLSCIFYSCENNYGKGTGTTSKTLSLEDKIKALEDKILELQQDKLLSDAESKEKVKALQNQLEALKSSLYGSATTTSVSSGSVGFSYILNDGEATVTGYSGSEKHLVIPSKIDGYNVVAIADNAFQNCKFETVIIASGIQEIGWFSFADSPLLAQITIPKSVERIRYGAFEGHGKSFTILCFSGSFAKDYAESYGIAYTII